MYVDTVFSQTLNCVPSYTVTSYDTINNIVPQYLLENTQIYAPEFAHRRNQPY